MAIVLVSFSVQGRSVAGAWEVEYYITIVEFGKAFLRLVSARGGMGIRCDLTSTPVIPLGATAEDIASAVKNVEPAGLKEALVSMLLSEEQKRVWEAATRSWCEACYHLDAVR